MVNRCRLGRSFLSKTDCMLIKAFFLYGQLEKGGGGGLVFFNVSKSGGADPLLQVLRTMCLKFVKWPSRY